MKLKSSRWKYLVRNWYNRRWLNLNVNTSISGTWQDNFDITLYYYAVQWRYYQLGKHHSTYPEMNMLLRSDTTVGLVICMYIVVSVDHAKSISVLYIICMLPSNILITWYMLLHLSRYECVWGNWLWSCSFHSNLNTLITGKYKDNFVIIFFIYTVQQRY